MGPDCQLLEISVALLMDGGRLASVCDGLDPGTEGLVCQALRQAMVAFVMYEPLHR